LHGLPANRMPLAGYDRMRRAVRKRVSRALVEGTATELWFCVSHGLIAGYQRP